MALTAAEQYAIEILNRARLDPVGEARRHGLSLNDGVTGNHETIVARPMQVLAPNANLDRSATNHGQWMIDKDIFSHTEGSPGSSSYYPWDRIELAGYNLTGRNGTGENIALLSVSGRSATTLVELHHGQWMDSAAHRSAMLNDDYREIGYAQVMGNFSGTNSSAGVQNFAYSGNRYFVTGVAYSDKNGNSFYNVGEGQGGVAFAIEGGASQRSASAGGYSLLSGPEEVVVRVTAKGGTVATRVELDLDGGNVKLDLISGKTLAVSDDAELLSGPIRNLKALGIANIDLTGGAEANVLTGNKGKNELVGGGGSDKLEGLAGADTLIGGKGFDKLFGGLGADRLVGGDGNDRLTGGAGADAFVFAKTPGRDTVRDFKAGQGDKLLFDDALWSGQMTEAQVVRKFADVTAAGVVFDFDNGVEVVLSGLRSTNGLADRIDII